MFVDDVYDYCTGIMLSSVGYGDGGSVLCVRL